eukprot:TRINITY_DN20335_c0_g1_i3.p1 TRINITY_DN20335_c0_g1~~TRINITY_DN20335_c0_g1_i3.p1  ORF type:complete len:115 (-),score=8.37 TRINITY_DN20335_c0_g1_i3:289-633(-)
MMGRQHRLKMLSPVHCRAKGNPLCNFYTAFDERLGGSCRFQVVRFSHVKDVGPIFIVQHYIQLGIFFSGCLSINPSAEFFRVTVAKDASRERFVRLASTKTLQVARDRSALPPL